MAEHDFKKGDRIEAVKRPRGKQTIPAGARGIIIDVNPQIAELVWVRTDEPVLTKSGKNQDFWVCAEEIKKI